MTRLSLGCLIPPFPKTALKQCVLPGEKPHLGHAVHKCFATPDEMQCNDGNPPFSISSQLVLASFDIDLFICSQMQTVKN